MGPGLTTMPGQFRGPLWLRDGLIEVCLGPVPARQVAVQMVRPAPLHCERSVWSQQPATL